MIERVLGNPHPPDPSNRERLVIEEVSAERESGFEVVQGAGVSDTRLLEKLAAARPVPCEGQTEPILAHQFRVARVEAQCAPSDVERLLSVTLDVERQHLRLKRTDIV